MEFDAIHEYLKLSSRLLVDARVRLISIDNIHLKIGVIICYISQLYCLKICSCAESSPELGFLAP